MKVEVERVYQHCPSIVRANITSRFDSQCNLKYSYSLYLRMKARGKPQFCPHCIGGSREAGGEEIGRPLCPAQISIQQGERSFMIISLHVSAYSSPTLDAARKGFRRLEVTVDQVMVGLVVGDRCNVAGEDAA